MEEPRTNSREFLIKGEIFSALEEDDVVLECGVGMIFFLVDFLDIKNVKLFLLFIRNCEKSRTMKNTTVIVF